MDYIARLLKKPTVADLIDWYSRHSIKPPSALMQIKLAETSPFSGNNKTKIVI